MAQTVLHPDLLDACVRDELNNTATRWVGPVVGGSICGPREAGYKGHFGLTSFVLQLKEARAVSPPVESWRCSTH